jgi:hypothetical protein
VKYGFSEQSPQFIYSIENNNSNIRIWGVVMKTLKKLSFYLFIISMIVLIVCAAIPINSTSASVRKVTPWKGNSGRIVSIHGSGFSSGDVVVKFGKAESPYVNAINDKNVKVAVPEKDVTDPNPVEVTVYIDGILIPSDMEFYYWSKGGK